MSQDADNLYIVRTKAVAGCFTMFLLMFGLTFIPLFFPASQVLLAKGLLFPLLFALEFVVLVPLYYFFFRKREGLGKGIFNAVVCHFVRGAAVYSAYPAMVSGPQTNRSVGDQPDIPKQLRAVVIYSDPDIYCASV